VIGRAAHWLPDHEVHELARHHDFPDDLLAVEMPLDVRALQRYAF
jgi:hypothetical protein